MSEPLEEPKPYRSNSNDRPTNRDGNNRGRDRGERRPYPYRQPRQDSESGYRADRSHASYRSDNNQGNYRSNNYNRSENRNQSSYYQGQGERRPYPYRQPRQDSESGYRADGSYRSDNNQGNYRSNNNYNPRHNSGYGNSYRNNRSDNYNNYRRDERDNKPRFTPEVVHEMLFATKPRIEPVKKPYAMKSNDPLVDMDEFFFENNSNTDTISVDKNPDDNSSPTNVTTSSDATASSATTTNGNTAVETNDTIISVTPTLLEEYSIWKGKTLSEYSLHHLLTLTLLYRNHFFPSLKSDQHSEPQDPDVANNADDTNSAIKTEPTEPASISTNTLKDWQTWQSWLQEHSANEEFKESFLNQELSDNTFVPVFHQTHLVEEGAPKAKEEISKYLIGWDWQRLPLLRQLVLLAAWVLIKHASPTQVKPLLNDAINHAKWFGDEQDSGFVNSVLDKLISERNLWP